MLICRNCSQFHCPELAPRRSGGGRELTSLERILYVRLLYSAVFLFVCVCICVSVSVSGVGFGALPEWEEASFIPVPVGYQLEEQTEVKH